MEQNNVVENLGSVNFGASTSTGEHNPQQNNTGTYRLNQREVIPKFYFNDSDSLCSTDTNTSSVMPTNNSDSEDDFFVLKKPKPKHNWFALSELAFRQLGDRARKHSSSFPKRYYGSLHGVQRLDLKFEIEIHDSYITSLNFHPKGDLLASGTIDSKILVYDWKKQKAIIKFKTKFRSDILQSKFLHIPGELCIASSSLDGQVRLTNLSDSGSSTIKNLGRHKGPCRKINVLKDQPSVILSAGEDAVTLRHDIRTSKSEKILKLKYNSKNVRLFSISTNPLNSNEFCLAGSDYIVRTFDQRKCSSTNILSEYYPAKLSNHKPAVYASCAIYNHDGSEILVSYYMEDIYLFDTKGSKGSFIHQFQGHLNGQMAPVDFFGPKSEFIMSFSDCGHIYFWERDTEAIVGFLRNINAYLPCLAPHPYAPILCTNGVYGDIKVWFPSLQDVANLDGLPAAVQKNYEISRQNKEEINFLTF